MQHTPLNRLSSRRPLAGLLAVVAVLGIPASCGDDDGSDAQASDTGAGDTGAGDTGTATSAPSGGDASDSDGSGDEGAPSEGAGGGSSVECGSIDPSVVGAIMGTAPVPTEESNLGVSSCVFSDGEDFVAVNWASTEVYSAVLESLEGASTTPVDGVGERAFLADGSTTATSGGTRGATLWVVDGDSTYSFSARLDSGEVDPTLLEELASDVLA